MAKETYIGVKGQTTTTTTMATRADLVALGNYSGASEETAAYNQLSSYDDTYGVDVPGFGASFEVDVTAAMAAGVRYLIFNITTSIDTGESFSGDGEAEIEAWVKVDGTEVYSRRRYKVYELDTLTVNENETEGSNTLDLSEYYDDVLTIELNSSDIVFYGDMDTGMSMKVNLKKTTTPMYVKEAQEIYFGRIDAESGAVVPQKVLQAYVGDENNVPRLCFEAQ